MIGVLRLTLNACADACLASTPASSACTTCLRAASVASVCSCVDNNLHSLYNNDNNVDNNADASVASECSCVGRGVQVLSIIYIIYIYIYIYTIYHGIRFRQTLCAGVGCLLLSRGIAHASPLPSRGWHPDAGASAGWRMCSAHAQHKV